MGLGENENQDIVTGDQAGQPARVLIVDDDRQIRDLLAIVLRNAGMTCDLAATGRRAIAQADEGEYDVAIVDLGLPDIEGLEVVRSIRQRNPATRVVVITGHGDVFTASQALRARADDYILKPFQVDDVIEAVKRALLRRQAVEQTVAMQKELKERVTRLQDEVKKQFSGGVAALATALEARDPYTKGHSVRVAGMSLQLASRMGRDQQMCDDIAVGALLHDIGKIAVPDEILRKQGALSSEEYGKIRLHTRAGYEILLPLFGQGTITHCALYHHERWDGHGYPEGIAGDRCPLPARIITVCDAYEAMTSERPYRPGLPESKALSEIKANRGRQFDPDVADLFVATRPDLNLPDRAGIPPSS